MKDYSWICREYTRLKPRLVILYGSRARGDHLEDSDIDILVVADNLPRDPREAYAILQIPEHPQIQPIGINTEDFTRKLREGNTFILEAIEDGIILCADNKFKQQILKEYIEARKKYHRKGKTWIKKT